MKTILRNLIISIIVVGFISAPMNGMTQSVLAAPANCADSFNSVGAYTVEVCITSPNNGDTLSSNATITGTASVLSGTNPGVQQMIFDLGGTYLLTAFSSPYTFTLPTNRYVDGSYTLSAQALMRDGFTTSAASISITLSTLTLTPPVNTNTFTPTSGRPAGGQPFVVATVGDGAGGEPNTTKVTDMIANVNPNLFLYLGDVYEQGSIAEFYNWYGTGTFFGQFRSITDPTVGHHEYLSVGAAPYYYYWDNVPKYYSFNANGWHFISLNSNGINIGGVGPNSPEYKWLQADLAANPSPCTIAYFHHPLYSIGPEGVEAAMVDIWKLLAQNEVDIVLTGNDHDYERWKPMNDNGVVSPTGMTEFVLGVGGHSMQTVVNSDSRVAFWTDANPAGFGALFLTLNPTSASFSYRSALDGSVLDSGNIGCVDPSIPIHIIYYPLIFR